MENRKVSRVVIAGGGTAGWIAAAALSKQLGPLLEITLVESDQIGTVGVGESTIPPMRSFNKLLGLDERAFMRETQASFKLGIAFEHWGRRGDRYIHSFGTIGRSTWLGEFHHIWLDAKARGLTGELGDYCYELQAAEQGRFATSDSANINYAYHLDATAYGRFLRQVSEDKAVTRIEGKIVGVQQHPETGFIDALVLESGQVVWGDLFIDCTGFRGLLIGETLDIGYDDWSHWLPTDRAVPLQTGSVGPARPYTRAIAHDAGWQWQIPLQHRVGNGLVYCSRYLSDDEASARLLANVDGEALTEPRVIRYRTGRRRRTWEKNCIALGLASGFVEPLESTSIHLIITGVLRLMQLFPFDGINDALVCHYNDAARVELEQIRDFIILHYKLNERSDDAFWRECREMPIPDSLAHRIELFQGDAQAYQAPNELFRVDSWVQVMLGQGLLPRGHHPVGRLMTDAQLQDALARLRAGIAKAVAKLPEHQTFLARYCGEPAPV